MTKQSMPAGGLPGLKELQDFWQSALSPGGAPAVLSPDMLGDFQAASARWMSHRQEEFGKAVAVFSQISTCRNPAEALALQQKWFAESTQSLIADWMALVTPAAPGAHREPTPPLAPVPEKRAHKAPV